jgi:uncharacterized YccA/Bax inhibitor family protein
MPSIIPNTNAMGSPLLSHVAAVTSDRNTTVLVPKVIGLALILLMFSAVAGYGVWLLFPADAVLARNFGFGAGLVAFGLAITASFKPQWSVWLAPLYALTGGVFMGGLSFTFEQQYPGIALQTVLVTGCVFVSMLLLYSGGILRATPRYRLMVYVATIGILLAYLVVIVLSFFGQSMAWLQEGSWVAILWFGFVALIAALNLVLDFERIDNLRRQQQPDYIHWYVALGLMVTIVWLYISILRLIANLRR